MGSSSYGHVQRQGLSVKVDGEVWVNRASTLTSSLTRALTWTATFDVDPIVDVGP